MSAIISKQSTAESAGARRPPDGLELPELFGADDDAPPGSAPDFWEFQDDPRNGTDRAHGWNGSQPEPGAHGSARAPDGARGTS